MEEEIIVPEEATFDYNKLRYILDKDGYVCHASIGAFIVCDLGECTEYNGKVPAGYVTVEEWYDRQIEDKKLNSWKIVEGNLVYDPDRDYKLALQYDEDAKQYGHVTHKELGITTAEQEKAYNDLFPSHKSGIGEILNIDDSVNYVGNLPTDSVTITGNNIAGLIELEFIGRNFLPNTATSSSNNGINYTVETDKKISISGISTDKSTFNLAGTDTSLRKILTFKRKDYNSYHFPNDTLNYLISGLDENTNLEFYYYDGTDRTLVGIYNNGLITFEEDTPVTQIVLTIESGISINTTIAPMLSTASTEYTYLATKINGNGQYVYTNDVSFFTSEKYQLVAGNRLYTVTTPTGFATMSATRAGIIIDIEQHQCQFVLIHAGNSFIYDYIDCDYHWVEYPYEAYKNNYTLIDLGEHTLTEMDLLELKDNHIIFTKNNFTRVDDETGEEIYMGEEYYLGDVVMPKTYEPITKIYSHQQVRLSIVYKDPRNIDITKISLKGLIQTMDIESTYNFTEEDYTKVRNYIMGEYTLTEEEYELYDINGDGVVTSSDYMRIKNMVEGVTSSTIKGSLEINTTQSQRTIVLRDEEEKITTSIGLGGITTPSLSVGGISVDRALTHSTNETKIGTWIDGNPIYRKIFSGSTGTGKNLSVALSNDVVIGSLINCYGHVQGSSGEQLGVLSDKQAILLSNNHKSLTYFFNNTDSYSYTYNIIVEYTKTTE